MCYKRGMRILMLVVLGGLAACGPSSWEEVRYEGEAETRKFVGELKKIETKEDLYRAMPRIKKRFNKMADLLVEIARVEGKKPGADCSAGDELFAEMARIYEIPGGREAIEGCQTEAVRKLDKAKIGR